MYTPKDKNDLFINGLATDHIWLMEDGPDTHPIGVRLDCGDSGTVYMSREQALDLAHQIQTFV